MTPAELGEAWRKAKAQFEEDNIAAKKAYENDRYPWIRLRRAGARQRFNSLLSEAERRLQQTCMQANINYNMKFLETVRALFSGHEAGESQAEKMMDDLERR